MHQAAVAVLYKLRNLLVNAHGNADPAVGREVEYLAGDACECRVKRPRCRHGKMKGLGEVVVIICLQDKAT